MKKMIIYNVIIFIITMGVILFYTKDMIGDDFVNIITLVAAAVILIATVAIMINYANHMKNTTQEGELFPYSWDDIREYNNEIPKGWAIAFLASIAFVMYYILIGYPTWSFSQIGQYNEEVLSHHVKYEKKFKDISDSDLEKMGESIFLVQCASCHGVLADGMNGSSKDLVAWSNEKNIEDVINNGSYGMGFATGAMPAGLVDKQSAIAISAYVSKEIIGSTTSHLDLVAKGKQAYDMSCAGCHNIDGTGIEGVAPSLANLVSGVLTTGKQGSIGLMPDFKGILNDTQKNALQSYIYTLNN